MNLEELIQKFDTENDFISAVNQAIIKVASDNLNFVYPKVENSLIQLSGCGYNSGPNNDPDKCTGCIFGKAFQQLGCDKSELDFCGDIHEVMCDFNVKCPFYWLIIQTLQDNGCRWGELIQFLPNGSHYGLFQHHLK